MASELLQVILGHFGGKTAIVLRWGLARGFDSWGVLCVKTERGGLFPRRWFHCSVGSSAASYIRLLMPNTPQKQAPQKCPNWHHIFWNQPKMTQDGPYKTMIPKLDWVKRIMEPKKIRDWTVEPPMKNPTTFWVGSWKCWGATLTWLWIKLRRMLVIFFQHCLWWPPKRFNARTARPVAALNCLPEILRSVGCVPNAL